MPRVVALIALATVLASSASADPSFDCAKAQTPSEKTICADEGPTEGGLQWFDRQLARLFKLARDQAGAAREDVIAGQRRFITQRDACIGVACVVKAYERRLAELAPRVNVFEAYAKYDSGDGAQVWIVRYGFDAGVLIGAVGGNGHLCGFETDSAQVGGKGVVRWRGDGDDACRIDIIPDGDDMRVETRDCYGYCGARASMNGRYTRRQD